MLVTFQRDHTLIPYNVNSEWVTGAFESAANKEIYTENLFDEDRRPVWKSSNMHTSTPATEDNSNLPDNFSNKSECLHMGTLKNFL